MLQLEEKTRPSAFALFELGFRPFFSAAAIYAVISMLLWMAIYVFSVPMSPAGLSTTTWHAHEMIYGYAMAVVAGFLLTAVGNWTGINGIRGGPLAVLLLLWLVARVAYFLPIEWALVLSAMADLLFTFGLIVGMSLPVIRVRQWKQLGIVSKLCLILATNAVFYVGAMGYLGQGVLWGLYGGFYLILALHAFAFGGVGLMTISMMSRVALGHTGRNVFNPPKLLGPVFALVVIGAITRVLIPIFDTAHYGLWVAVAQSLWILAFGIFLALYLPMLIRPRVDGRPG